MPFFSKHWPRASHLLGELLARLVSALVRCFYLDLIVLPKIHRTAVFVNVVLFLLLGERNIVLSYALNVVYTLSKLYGLLLIKFFISVC